MAGNRSLNNYVFYNNVSTITEIPTATMQVTGDASTMLLEIIGGGTFTIQVYGAIFDKTNFKAIPVLKMPTLDLITSTISDNTSFYQIDLTSVDYVKILISSLSSAITIRGKVVG